MKKLLFCLLLFISFFPVIAGQTGKKIVILHTNDIHSRLNGYAPELAYTPLTVNDDMTFGGFARIASVIKEEKEKNPGMTLTIDAGDFLMGTLFHSLEAGTGFQLRLMKKMGYDVVCFGNHEFDFGPEKIADIISKSAESGNIPSLVLGNAIFDEKNTKDDRLEKLFSDKTITRKLVIERNGLKIGIFSILGKEAAGYAPFSYPVKFSRQTAFAKAMVKELKSEHCDFIICVSHSGISEGINGEWGGEDVNLARSVKGIDLIISGHSHKRLDKPVVINNVPIVQTGEYGRFVGKLTLSLSDGGISIDDYRLIPADDKTAGDRETHESIVEQQKLVAEKILDPIGFGYFTPVAENDFALECNEQGDFKGSNLGPLVADAIHYYVNKHAVGGTDISMVAVGVIRDRIVPGIQTAPDIFRVMSLGSGRDDVPGYPLERLYVTGKELKSILEILQVAYKKSSSNFCYYSGIEVDYNPAKRFMRKITGIRIVRPNGEKSEVDYSKNNRSFYSLTADSYMLEFIGIIKKMSFGLINVVPRDAAGNQVRDMDLFMIDMNSGAEGIQEGKEWLALMEFLGSMKDINGNGIPDIDRKYSAPVQTFFLTGKK